MSSKRIVAQTAHEGNSTTPDDSLQVSQLDGSQPLPRPKRERRRAKADRGLPPDQELSRLATEYLKVQRKHWPTLVKSGLLPEANGETIAAMVENFKYRHRTGQVDVEPLRQFQPQASKLAGNYNRYSCDNSNPTSIIDQMVNSLDRARQDDRLVPWSYVFADYSVSGLDSGRQGYNSYKEVLSNAQHLIETTYVDDFSRASRDEIEWWKLAHLSRRLGKRMIGASDHFDLSAATWDLQVSLYGIFSRLFLKSLREKVMRGMKGAVRRGTCVGKLPLGFTRGFCRDQNGNVVRDADGLPTYQPCIDPVTAPSRKLMYELYVEKRWSAYKITKHFNIHKIDGWEGWTAAGIKKLLWSATAIGVFVWNKQRREFDFEEEKWVRVENPRSQWVVFYDRNLAIVSIETWKAARKRLAQARRKSPITGRKLSRNQQKATTLFSGTLSCGYCGRELLLCRSTSKYKVMGCLNGSNGAHGCELSTSKSTRIIESCLLEYLRETLLTEAALEKLVNQANAFLAEEAKKPRTDVAPLRNAIKKKEDKIRRYFQRMDDQTDESLIEAYDKHIATLQKEVNELKVNLHQAEAQNVAPPPPLDVDRVKAHLADLRALLNQEIPAAAEAIRLVTGPITIRQEKTDGKRGARWTATFSPDLLALVRQVAKDRDYPDCITLEHLCRRIWITPEKVQVSIEARSRPMQIARQAKQLAAKGNSINTIATLLGSTWDTAKLALSCDANSRNANHKHSAPTQGKNLSTSKIIDVDEVVRLRDEELLSFQKIARMLSVCKSTVARAYDRGRPRLIRDAAEQGRCPRRGRYSHLGPKVFAQIRACLQAGKKPSEIAAEIGCGTSTVYRVRRGMVG